jgi:y4mF family transcriptional regulator
VKASSVRDIAAIAKGRRKHLGLSQAKLATRTGVGREWVIEFEKGKSSVELGHVVRVLRELGLSIDLLAGSLPAETDGNELGMILGSTCKEAGRL